MSDRWELTPEQTPAFGPIAERFRRAGDLERAVELCREGLAKYPNHLSGRVTLGWALLDLGRYDEARAELERVVKRAPDNLAAIRGLAELHDRAENAVFVPADAHLAWPPKPDTIDAAGNGWVHGDGSAAEELPALLAELDPVLPAGDPATAADAVSAVSLGDLEIRAEAVSEPELIVSAVESSSLEDVVAELEAHTTPEPTPAPVQVAEPVIEAVLLPSEPVPEPNVEAVAVPEPEPAAPVMEARVEAAAATAEPEAMPEPVAELTLEPLPEPIDLAMPFAAEAGAETLPEPVVDLTADLDVDGVAALPLDFEAPRPGEDFEPVLELTLETGSDPLLEAVEAVEMSLDVPDPAAPLAAAMNADLAVELDAPVLAAADPVMDDVEVALDPALFELARAASDEPAMPGMDVLRDEVFELDQEHSVDMTALLETPPMSDFHPPESVAATPMVMDEGGRERRQAMHDLQFDTPGLTPADELPAHEFHEIDAAAPAASARDAHAESAMLVSQDFGSMMEATRDFSSPQVSTFEHADPDLLPLPELEVEIAPTSSMPDPAIAFVDTPSDVAAAETIAAPLESEAEPVPVAAAQETPPVAERVTPPPPVAAQPVTPSPTPPKPTKKKKPVAGLQRFLKGIEDRKAKLARNSAA